MNKRNEQTIKRAALQAHELFLRNNWSWGGSDMELEYVPSTAQIEKHIRYLFGESQSSGKYFTSGRIGVSENDDLVDIEIRFSVGHLEKELKKNNGKMDI